MDYAFQYIISTGGLHKEDDYPYLMEEGICQEQKVTKKTHESQLTMIHQLIKRHSNHA